MFRFLSEWKAMKRFQALPSEQRQLIFYAETKADWVYFAPIIDELKAKGQSFCYLTSDPDDPVLKLSESEQQLIRPFFIGSGMVCTIVFKSLEAKVMVMTLTDLDSYHLKRSSAAPVHYLYVFHSIVSSHMVFRKKAYWAYDTVLCVGPHHVREIRKTEEIYGLKPKKLVNHGYGRLDRILKDAQTRPPFVPSSGPSKKVLIAPSWGASSVTDVCAEALIDVLLKAGHSVVMRPHPMTVRQQPALIDGLKKRFSSHSSFQLETDVRSTESLHSSDLMISDWSGAALEYAFGLERPVLFIETERKINNPEYEKIGCDPLEVFIRHEVGAVVAPDKLREVPDLVARLCGNPAAFSEQIRKARAQWIFNVGTSGKVGAEAVLEALSENK